MFIINTSSTCFGHHYAHLQENKTCVTARGVLHWFCWMWLVAVVGRCLVGCEHCEGYCSIFTVLAPHNRYQPHSAEPAQHTTCSNTRLVLLKMGIMMPETCWGSIDNKHLTVASCWFSFSLHNLLTMHGHRNLNAVVHWRKLRTYCGGSHTRRVQKRQNFFPFYSILSTVPFKVVPSTGNAPFPTFIPLLERTFCDFHESPLSFGNYILSDWF